MSDETAGDGVEQPRSAVRSWFDARFRSPAAIYGLIVFTALITIASDHADDVWDMLTTAVATLAVFFIAHVFAHTLTDHGEHGLGRATRRAMVHASGMLYASSPAIVVLVAAGFLGSSVDDALDATLIVAIIMLAVLGYGAYARRGSHMLVRLLGAAGTAILGLFIVLLEYVLH